MSFPLLFNCNIIYGYDNFFLFRMKNWSDLTLWNCLKANIYLECHSLPNSTYYNTRSNFFDPSLWNVSIWCIFERQKTRWIEMDEWIEYDINMSHDIILPNIFSNILFGKFLGNYWNEYECYLVPESLRRFYGEKRWKLA